MHAASLRRTASARVVTKPGESRDPTTVFPRPVANARGAGRWAEADRDVDRGEGLRALLRRDRTFPDGAVERPRGVGDAALSELLGDVLERDGPAPERALGGDPAPHDPRAGDEHAMAHRRAGVRRAFGGGHGVASTGTGVFLDFRYSQARHLRPVAGSPQSTQSPGAPASGRASSRATNFSWVRSRACRVPGSCSSSLQTTSRNTFRLAAPA